MRDNWDQIFSIIHYVEGAVGISLNVLLIYLTIFVHTPAIREYRVLLGNAAVTDLITTIAILLVQPRSKTPSAIVQNDLQQRIPVYNLSGEVVFGSILPRNPLGIISSVIIFLPMFPIYGLVFYVRHKVHEFIDDDTRHNFSEVVKKGHKKLMLALTVHAALPAIFVFVPFGLMLCYHIGIMRFILFEYLVFTMFALLPIARPIVNLTFVRPYNKALRHMITGNLCVHKMQIQDVSHYTNINGKRVSIKR
ncbi:Serpentine receptor class delta-2 [Toxocara canis]|uniref:Serpentine receptor class delta-2 n=1 Tax=Toxocara canis TaxID=6265 RepID=A0A0B2V292_TOXCA|nr:Serpentine receptor class delta-2 [Toxocara canis]